MQKTSADPYEFIASLPEEYRDDVATLDRRIGEVMKGQSRVLWEGVFWGGSEQRIIGYGDYTYERRGKALEWFVVGLALQKNYISVYVNAAEDGKYLVETMGTRLGKAKIGKSSISFRRLSEIDVEELIAIVERARAVSA